MLKGKKKWHSKQVECHLYSRDHLADEPMKKNNGTTVITATMSGRLHFCYENHSYLVGCRIDASFAQKTDNNTNSAVREG